MYLDCLICNALTVLYDLACLTCAIFARQRWEGHRAELDDVALAEVGRQVGELHRRERHQARLGIMPARDETHFRVKSLFSKVASEREGNNLIIPKTFAMKMAQAKARIWRNQHSFNFRMLEGNLIPTSIHHECDFPNGNRGFPSEIRPTAPMTRGGIIFMMNTARS